jgi:hypothetical protein
MTHDQLVPRVFISHQWMDKQLADRLARELESSADVWMDYRNLRPGDRIQDTIDDALRGTDVMLVLWTAHAQASAGVAAEIRTALDLGIRIVPCFFTYDDAGRPTPPLPAEINDLLGVDFHHHNTGVAQIAELLLHLQTKRLPAEVVAGMDEHPGRRMLHYLRGYLGYLANYRNMRGVPDERAQWVDRIIGEIERYVASGGDTTSVRMLLEAARRSEVDDAEGIGMLITRLDAVLAGHASAAAGQSAGPGRAAPRPASAHNVAASAGAPAWPREVDVYLDSARPALDALTAYAAAAGSAAGVHVVTQLRGYLDHADDLIPDHQGRSGMLDDAWLIINTAFRLIESGLVPAAAVPIDWRTIIAADHTVRELIPPAALNVLSGAVLEMLQIIAAEVAAYQPWFTPQGHGYAPVMAAPAARGGSWEDQMNERLLGTGLSIYG